MGQMLATFAMKKAMTRQPTKREKPEQPQQGNSKLMKLLRDVNKFQGQTSLQKILSTMERFKR